MYESAHGVVDIKLGSMVAVFQGRPKNHQRHCFDDGSFRIQWFIVAALNNEVFGTAFEKQKALAKVFVGQAIISLIEISPFAKRQIEKSPKTNRFWGFLRKF